MVRAKIIGLPATLQVEKLCGTTRLCAVTTEMDGGQKSASVTWENSSSTIHTHQGTHILQVTSTSYNSLLPSIFFFFTWKRPWASYCTWKRKGYSLKQAHITLVMTRACMHSSSTKDTLFQNQHTPLVNAPEGKRRQKHITSKRDKWTSASEPQHSTSWNCAQTSALKTHAIPSL